MLLFSSIAVLNSILTSGCIFIVLPIYVLMVPGVAADDFVGSLEGAVIVGAAESEVRGAQSFNSHRSLASSLLESTADEAELEVQIALSAAPLAAVLTSLASAPRCSSFLCHRQCGRKLRQMLLQPRRRTL